jgi:type I restriction enzyme R subunit
MDILGSFMFVEKHDEKVDDGDGGQRRVTKETLVFPRYHQLDAVRKLIDASSREGAGNNYLIQHSAGSGKTNSISWLSHRLASLHTDKDEKVFDCVVVITDRRVLDQQLQDAVYQIEHQQGVVQAIDEDSRQLAKSLTDGTKIVITTLQKFPFVMRGLLHQAGADNIDRPTAEEREQAKEWQEAIADRRYAVIVDEAHSSQTGETARELKAVLGVAKDGDEDDAAGSEDMLNAVMESRGRQQNISFYAFTATPKGKTLELFGRKGPSGNPEAFHVYSMRQAIEEGFILDVLTKYTTYKTYYRLQKEAADDRNFPKKAGAKALAKFMSLHPHNVAQKTEVIVEHFREHVKPLLNGQAKAMVVTSSRLHAVRFMQAFENYIRDNGYTDIRPLVAFSGTVRDPDTGQDYTEPGMNIEVITGRNIRESALPDRFASPDYNVLLVANKYQTGFDQPLLQAMYVDKRLDGVQAVQTLSRLNRMIPGKDAPFVLDFVNEAEDILRAFKPYYDATRIDETSDPRQLDELKHALDETQVYHWSEVQAFRDIFYKRPEDQTNADHAELERLLQPAVDRFKSLDGDDEQTDFRDKLGAYVKLYSFLSQVLPYGDEELEMLYSYGRLLLQHLPSDRGGATVNIGDDVGLRYYRLQRVFSGAIPLSDGEGVYVHGPVEVGTGRAKDDEAPLSEIIKVLNDRFGLQLTLEDDLFFKQVKARAESDERVIQTARANPQIDKFQLGIKRLIEEMMIGRMADNDQLVSRYMSDPEFQSVAFPVLAREIFEAVQATA